MSIRSTELNPRVRRMIAEQDARRKAVPVPAMTVLIVLPLPGKYLWPNSPTCPQAKRREVAEYRGRARDHVLRLMGYAQRLQGWAAATAQATFYFRTKRMRDPDNCLAALKPVWDGLQEAGLLVNDKDMTHLPVIRRVDRDNPRVEIRVWPTEGAAT